MKEEYQSMIDSIRECIPLDGVQFQDDALRHKRILNCKQIKFVEMQEGDRLFVESFKSQAKITRLASNSDLVLNNIREVSRHA